MSRIKSFEIITRFEWQTGVSFAEAVQSWIDSFGGHRYRFRLGPRQHGRLVRALETITGPQRPLHHAGDLERLVRRSVEGIAKFDIVLDKRGCFLFTLVEYFRDCPELRVSLSEARRRERKVTEVPLEEIELSVRPYNLFWKADIETAGEIIKHSEADLRKKGFRRRDIVEVRDVLASMGLSLRK